MHDLRFYQRISDVTLQDLAILVGGEVFGDSSAAVVTVAAAEHAERGSICFAEGKADHAKSVNPAATACFVTEKLREYLPQGMNAIVCENPRYAFSRAALSFLQRREISDTYDDLGPAQLHPSVKVGPHAVISDGVEIGQGSVLGPNTVIGPGVRIGTNCTIGANTVIESALIGNNVTIKANSTIGGTGFGVVQGPTGLMQAPHFGRVVIQDFVSIGSCVCVDRGAFDDTVVGEGTRIDNFAQIAHNVVLGRNCVLAAFAGLSGSVTVEDGVMMGGRVGIADHTHIGAGARLAADSAIMRDIPAGETWGGSPAKPLTQWMREVAWLSRNALKKKPK